MSIDREILDMPSTRRRFLVRASVVGAASVSGSAVLAACGGGDEPSTASGPTLPVVTADPALTSGFGVAQRFPNTALFVPGPLRLPVSIVLEGTLSDDGPDTLEGFIIDLDDNPITDIVATKRTEGIEAGYYEVRVELEAAKVYTLRLAGDDGYGATFEVFEPGDVRSPLTGAPMPALDTPTLDDPRGLEVVCSRAPDPCPFHSLTLADALALGKPVAFIVGTPAHCQTGTCGPGLDLLIAESERLGDALVCVHADVYRDAAGTETAPVIESLGIDYEPILYLTDASGTIVDRLDAIWDAGELRSRLDLLFA